jgi:predicted Na+-dependent transporter
MPGEWLAMVSQAGMLVFVVAGMASMGLALTIGDIARPLREGRLVGGLLVANFVVVPSAAVAAARLLPMAPDAATAVIVLGCVAGAPFLVKLVQVARGDMALGVGGIVLLMVVTVGFAPVVIPIAVTGATVDALRIGQYLVLLMLIPLGVGLALRVRVPGPAARAQPFLARASTVGLGLGLAGGVLTSWRDIAASVGSGIFAGTAIVVGAGVGAGWLLGHGRSAGDRAVLALATGQRNVAASIVVAASIGGATVVYSIVASLVVTFALVAVAAAFGRRPAAGGRVSPRRTAGEARRRR